MMEYIGYRPVLNCCKPPKELYGSSLYLCPTHGYKSADLKPFGAQLILEL